MEIILPAIMVYLLIGCIAGVTFTDDLKSPDTLAATMFLWPVFAIAWILVDVFKLVKIVIRGSKIIFMEVIDVLQEE